MEILREQGLLLYCDMNPPSLKVFAWPVATIKEDPVAFLSIHPPGVPVLPCAGWERRDGENGALLRGCRAVSAGQGGTPAPGTASPGSQRCLTAPSARRREVKREEEESGCGRKGSRSGAAPAAEPAVGNVCHPAGDEAITLQSQLGIAANRFSLCFLG